MTLIRILIAAAALPFSLAGFLWWFIVEAFEAGRYQWPAEISVLLFSDRYGLLDPLNNSCQVPVAPDGGEAPEPPGRFVSPPENSEVPFPDGC